MAYFAALLILLVKVYLFPRLCAAVSHQHTTHRNMSDTTTSISASKAGKETLDNSLRSTWRYHHQSYTPGILLLVSSFLVSVYVVHLRRMRANADKKAVGPPRRHNLALDNNSSSGAKVQEIPPENPYITSHVRSSITAGASAVGFVSLVTECIDVYRAKPVLHIGSVVGIVCTAISFVVALWDVFENVNDLRGLARKEAGQTEGRITGLT
jgi:predicted RND superfamily exporter protein